MRSNESLACRKICVLFRALLLSTLWLAGISSTFAAERFLLLVDNSLSMAKFDTNLRQAVFDLIYSGFGDQMKDGDTFGVWTYREEPDTSFPIEAWEDSQKLALATRATLFVKGQRYAKTGELDVALKRTVQVVDELKDLTIFVLSDGAEPIQGTPVDAEINAAYEQHRAEMQRTKQPFLTTLVARGGRLVAWSVNSPAEPLKVARLAEVLEAAAKMETAAVTNAPVPVLTNAVAAKSLPASNTVAAPVTPQTVTPSNAPSPALPLSRSRQPVAPVPTNLPPAITPAENPVPQAVAAAATVTNSPPKPVSAPPPTPATPAAAPGVAVAAPAVTAAVPPPPVTRPPIILTKETLQKSMLAEAAALTQLTTPAPEIKPQTQAVALTQMVVNAVTTAPAILPNLPTPKADVSSQAVARVSAISNTVAKAGDSFSPVSKPIGHARSSAPSGVVWVILGGFLLLLAALVVALWLRQLRSPQPSLISRSLRGQR